MTTTLKKFLMVITLICLLLKHSSLLLDKGMVEVINPEHITVTVIIIIKQIEQSVMKMIKF